MHDVGDTRMIIFFGMNKEQTESVVHHALKEDDVREATFFFKCLIPVPKCGSYVISTAVDVFIPCNCSCNKLC